LSSKRAAKRSAARLSGEDMGRGDAAASKAGQPGEENASQRLDRWLWYARVAKTRTLAAGLVSDGKVRVNRVKIDKPAHSVKAGDTVAVMAHRRLRVLEITALGERRGPADEAAQLFTDVTPEDANPKPPSGLAGLERVAQLPGGPRPTKRERRKMDAWDRTLRGDPARDTDRD